jgi:hypothetical protein
MPAANTAHRASQRHVERFHARSFSTAEQVARTQAKAHPSGNPSFHCQAIMSRCPWPPTWLHAVKAAIQATRNSNA